MKKQFLKIIGSTLIVGLFLFMAFGSDDSKVDKGNNGQKSEPTNSRPTKLSDGEKKIKCLRMFGGGDMSAWETAQAECMLNNSQSACECMSVLSK
jgi:hypothetical protein